MLERKGSISGFLNVDKPPGWTSSDVVAKLRSVFQLRKRRIKIGHGGTLDPMATGVLPICVGSATRLSKYVLSGDKEYVMTAQLGITTDSYDAEGAVTMERDASGVTRAQLSAVLDEFRGEIDQIPPMFSAIKRDGQPLYKLARQGVSVPRDPRRVNVSSLELIAWASPEFQLRIECSSGFYARSLAHDIGERLGCGAHMTSLRRARAGQFAIAESNELETLIASGPDDAWLSVLLPPDCVLHHLASVALDDGDSATFMHGGMLMLHDWEPGDEDTDLRVYGVDGLFLGLARLEAGRSVLRPSMVLQRIG